MGTMRVILSDLLVSVPIPAFPTPVPRADRVLVNSQSTQQSVMDHAVETVHALMQLVSLPHTL